MIRAIKAIPIFLGPFITTVAMLVTHVVGLLDRPDEYVEAPPTISRLLTKAELAEPFALAMIVAAFFLTIAICQVGLFLYRSLRVVEPNVGKWAVLFAVCAISESAAVVGMIVLSQYTGDIYPTLHDVGSYMLFFGHTIGFIMVGLLVRNALVGLHQAQQEVPAALAGISSFPRRSVTIAVLSLLFGLVYFGGKLLPEGYFFWQRVVLSGLEIIVILSFLAYLVSFEPHINAARKRRRNTSGTRAASTDLHVRAD